MTSPRRLAIRRARNGWIAACLGCALAMSPAAARASDDETTFREQHRRTQLAGMGVLTGWAVANIGSGIAGAVLVEGDRRHVHEMNAMWNTVNLTLGIVGLVTQARRATKSDPQDVHRIYRKTRTTYAVNGVLDVVYIGGGILTAELGRRHGSARAQGYGTSVVFQGAFLLLFDLGMLIAHERMAARLPDLRVVPTLSANAFGVCASGSF